MVVETHRHSDASLRDASLRELTAQLSAQSVRLVRDEMRLARRELQESGRHAGIGAGLLGVAAALAALASAAVVCAAIAAVWLALPVWASALLIGAALVAGSGLATLIARKPLAAARGDLEGLTIINADIRTYEMANGSDGADGMGPPPGVDADVGALKADIVRTRTRFDQTLDATLTALPAKFNVKQRIRRAANDAAARAFSALGKLNQSVQPAIAVSAFLLVAVIGVVMWVRRR